MIEHFKHKGLKRFYEKGDSSGIGANMRGRLTEILSVLEAASTIEEANIPGYRLHQLSGDRKGFWSVRVTGNWRVIFQFEEGKALDIDLIDYH